MSLAKALPTEDLDLVLAHTGELWRQMRGERVFIAGGTGFFGCWLLESFLHANERENLGARVTVLTRNPAAFQQKSPHLASDPAVTLLAGDVRDFAFPEGDFRYVIHAATESFARQVPTSQRDLLTTITGGTERMLQFAATHGASNFLLTSSGAVYGKQPSDQTHIPESYLGAPDPLEVSSAYGEGKRLAEQLCALYASESQMECKIARCFAFVGPHLPLNAHFAIGNFIGDVLAGRPIRIQGDGTPERSYLYAADLAIWLWTILMRGASLRAYNVGSDQSVSIAELALLTVEALKRQTAIEVMGKPNPDTPISRYVPSTRRAQEELGLWQHIPLKEAIRRTAAWHLAP